MYYAPWLGAGYLLFHQELLLDQLIDNVTMNSLNVIGFALLSPMWNQTGLAHYLAQIWQGSVTLSVCLILFWLARRFTDHQSFAVHSVADESCTMYLVHWPIMALLYSIAAFHRMPSTLLFVTLIILACALSYGIHMLVAKRFHLGAWLLNGRPLRSGQPWPAERSLATFCGWVSIADAPRIAD